MEKVGLRQFKLLVHDYKNNGRTMIFKIFIIMMTYVMMLYHMYDISYHTLYVISYIICYIICMIYHTSYVITYDDIYDDIIYNITYYNQLYR